MFDRYLEQNKELAKLNMILKKIYREEKYDDYINNFCNFLKTTSIDIRNMSVIDNFNFFCPMEIAIQLGGIDRIIYTIETCKNDTLKVLTKSLNNIRE